MAVVYATKTGNWSDTTVWSTGALPASTDDVYSNNFTVTINQTITVSTLNNGATTGVTAGGGFAVTTGGYTINATINAYGSTGVNNTASTGTLTINGNVNAGSGSNGIALYHNGNNNIVLTGNITGGTGSNSTGFRLDGGGTHTITGNIYSGSGYQGYGIFANATQTITLTGNAYGTGGNTAIQINQSATVTINGNVTGANNGGYYGVWLGSPSTVTINGNAIAGTLGNGAWNNSTGTMRVTRAVGSASVATGQVITGVHGNNNGGLTVVKEIEFGSGGQVPVSGYVKFDNAVTIVAQLRRENNTNITLTDAANASNQLPAITDVRSGVSYNQGNRVGTLAVPLPANVRIGIATDNTTGTAALSPADIWSVLTSDITTANSIGQRLKNAATVASTGDQIAASSL